MFSDNIRQAVNTDLGQGSSVPQDRLVQSLVEAEQARRTEILTNAFELQESLAGKLSGIDKPDEVLKDRSGKVLSEGFTDNRLSQIRKLDETVNNLETKVNDALTKADADSWKKLKEFVDKNSQKN